MFQVIYSALEAFHHFRILSFSLCLHFFFPHLFAVAEYICLDTRYDSRFCLFSFSYYCSLVHLSLEEREEEECSGVMFIVHFVWDNLHVSVSFCSP